MSFKKSDLKELSGHWVVVEIEGSKKKVVGFLDDVGIGQDRDKILLADSDPSGGHVFRGRKIQLSKIKNIAVTTTKKPSF